MTQLTGPSALTSPAGGGSARVLAVTSGKGGVGKTNVAVNLAARLSSMGRRILLLDADLGLANADVLCNVAARLTLAHVITGRCAVDRVMVDAPGGFTLVPGASGIAQMASLSEFERARIIDVMRKIEHDYDLIFIDTGAGISPNVLSFLEVADELLVITTPEPTSITDAYAMIKSVSRRREGVKVNLLVNMTRDRAEAQRVFERIDAVCRRFLGMPLTNAGWIVADPRVASSVRKRHPFVLEAPECPASACVRQLAHKLDRHAAEPSAGGFFRRVASWLAG